ncbi:MAG TPA: tetratricopeptide repeat protein [Gaiellaceae bacterium]|nr:tetratricopeptide repeat protein [Gaiellaceae bacterium]
MTEASFEREVLQRSHERPVVALFTSAALPLCRPWEAMLEEEARERDGRVALVAVDVDRSPGLAKRYGVQVIPTLRAFRRGEVVGGLFSARPRKAVAAFLDSLLGPSDAQRLLDELRAEREWGDVVAAIDECDYERAFRKLLARAERGDAEQRERVRRLMVSLFSELGHDHPLAQRYRRRLAAALY